MEIKDYKGIWVFAEQIAGELSGVAFELLRKARELKKTKRGRRGCSAAGR